MCNTAKILKIINFYGYYFLDFPLLTIFFMSLYNVCNNISFFTSNYTEMQIEKGGHLCLTFSMEARLIPGR